MLGLLVPVACVIVVVYLLHEAAENAREKRWTPMVFDLLFALPITAFCLVWVIPGALSAIMDFLSRI